MKGFLTLLVVLASVMAMSACEKSTVGAKGKKLTLVKSADQTIARGATDSVKISINRDAFRDAVEIKFEDPPHRRAYPGSEPEDRPGGELGHLHASR